MLTQANQHNGVNNHIEDSRGSCYKHHAKVRSTHQQHQNLYNRTECCRYCVERHATHSRTDFLQVHTNAIQRQSKRLTNQELLGQQQLIFSELACSNNRNKRHREDHQVHHERHGKEKNLVDTVLEVLFELIHILFCPAIGQLRKESCGNRYGQNGIWQRVPKASVRRNGSARCRNTELRACLHRHSYKRGNHNNQSRRANLERLFKCGVFKVNSPRELNPLALK